MIVTGAILSLPEVAEMTRLVSLKKELVEVVQFKDICFNISAAQLQAVALCGIINCGFPFFLVSVFHGLFSLNLSL